MNSKEVDLLDQCLYDLIISSRDIKSLPQQNVSNFDHIFI